MLFRLGFKTREEFANLVVLDGEHLLQSVDFDAEDLVLVLDVQLDVFELVLEHLLEFCLELVDLVVLGVHEGLGVGFLLVDEGLLALDLLVLLLADAFDLHADDLLHGLLLLDDPLEPPHLILVPLDPIGGLLLEAIQVPFAGRLHLASLLGCLSESPLLGLNEFFVEEVDLLEETVPLLGGVLFLGGLLLVFEAMAFGFDPAQLKVLRQAVVLGQQVVVLFQHQVVFYLEVFGLPQTHSSIAQLVLQQAEVVLEAVDLPDVEVHVVLRGGFRVDALVDLRFEGNSQLLGAQRHYY